MSACKKGIPRNRIVSVLRFIDELFCSSLIPKRLQKRLLIVRCFCPKPPLAEPTYLTYEIFPFDFKSVHRYLPYPFLIKVGWLTSGTCEVMTLRDAQCYNTYPTIPQEAMPSLFCSHLLNSYLRQHLAYMLSSCEAQLLPYFFRSIFISPWIYEMSHVAKAGQHTLHRQARDL